jgi:hypothetical protein
VDEESVSALGALLEQARVAATLSGREAARRSGISEGRWRQIVANGKAPSKTIVRMALAVEVEPGSALETAGKPATDEALAALVSEAKRPRATDPRRPVSGLAEEIDRIKGLPLDPNDKIRIANALIELYEESAQHGHQEAG